MTMKRTGDELADLVRIAPYHDTTGAPIPVGLPVAYTNRSDGQPLTATITDGTDAWVYTWTYDASGYVTAESGWVKQ